MKNMLPYYKRYPRDFIEGTIGLDLETKGAYSILLDLIYMQGGQLPDDELYIAGLLGCRAGKWRAIRSTLLEAAKITAIDGKISNSRALLEINSLKNFSENQAKNASGSRKNKEITETAASIRQRQPEPEPEPVNKNAPASPKKGMRIPDDFEPDVSAAVDAGLRPETALKEAANFKDYWKSKSGNAATKLDWPATWRMWVRNSVERQGGGRSSKAKSDFQQQQDRIRGELERSAFGETSHDQSSDSAKQRGFDLGAEDFFRN